MADHRTEVFVCDQCAEVSIRLPDTLDPPCCRACVNEARRAINRWARAEPTSGQLYRAQRPVPTWRGFDLR
jgi:hypothetical protein